jgi:erythronate-4-phosphate dehydrogenase
MRIVADENIPFAREAFECFGTVETCSGGSIDRSVVRDADVLLVRSVTPVGRGLLEGSSIRFVGSATIGTDHVDVSYLRETGIAFAYAPGSNAESVVEYVTSALFCLAVRRAERLREKTAGIVGCGNIGGRLARRLQALGLTVLCNDPPLAEAARGSARGREYVSLETVLDAADIVTIHVPLTRSGPHPTFHLFDRDVLRALKPNAWLINTARGSVIDHLALKNSVGPGRPSAAVLDVWEGEPDPDPELVARVDLATPHVAGYSYDGKVQGTLTLHDALAAFLGGTRTWDPAEAFAPADENRLRLTPPDPALPETDWLHDLVVRMFDISGDHARMIRIIDLPASDRRACFTSLRKNYPRRRAFARHSLRAHLLPASYRHAVAEGLGVRLVP